MLDSQELWEYFTNLTHFKEDLEKKEWVCNILIKLSWNDSDYG